MLRKLKFPILVALLLTLAVVLADKTLREFGGPILLLVYFVMMTKMIYDMKHKEKGDGKRHVS